MDNLIPDFFLIWNRKELLGTGDATKTDEFSGKFQTAFDLPPLIFGKSYCNFFPKNPL